MPQQTDLTVKDGANIDKTFTAISPAAGDGGVATWALKSGPISSVFPMLTAMATVNQNKTRVLRVKLTLPSSYQDSVTGRTFVNSQSLMDATFRIPADFPEDKKADWVAFSVNLLNTNLLKSMVRDGLSAT